VVRRNLKGENAQRGGEKEKFQQKGPRSFVRFGLEIFPCPKLQTRLRKGPLKRENLSSKEPRRHEKGRLRELSEVLRK